MSNTREMIVLADGDEPGESAAPDCCDPLTDAVIPLADEPVVPTRGKGRRSVGAASDKDQRAQADRLVELAAEAEAFRAPNGTAFADIIVNGHRETWPIRSPSFRLWLMRRLWETDRKAARSEAMSSALGLVEAKAQFDGEVRDVLVRVGHMNGRIHIDIGDATWRAVEIDAEGWRIVSTPPIHFCRAKGMLALPTPILGGSIRTLRKHVNVASESDFVLIVAWLLAALNGCGPYPVLALTGEQGSAKSTAARLLRSVVDPNVAMLRALPRDERDLFIAANNAHILAFDNVSNLPPWLSDALCRLATGGGFATRALYTNCEEMLFDAMRPSILNGIEDVISQPDLADRAIPITLAVIPESQRRTEAEVWAAVERDSPAILGALLTALSHGLRNLGAVKLERLPRMADFAKLIVACEPAIWSADTFMAAYDLNRTNAVDAVVEANPIAATIRQLVIDNGSWVGTPSELHAVLTSRTEPAIAQSKAWPKAANALSRKLPRIATALRQVGIEIVRDELGHAKAKLIRITSRPTEAEKISPASPAGGSSGGSQSKIAGDTAASAGDIPATAADIAGEPRAEKPRISAVACGAGGAGDTSGDLAAPRKKIRVEI